MFNISILFSDFRSLLIINCDYYHHSHCWLEKRTYSGVLAYLQRDYGGSYPTPSPPETEFCTQ